MISLRVEEDAETIDEDSEDRDGFAHCALISDNKGEKVVSDALAKAESPLNSSGRANIQSTRTLLRRGSRSRS